MEVLKKKPYRVADVGEWRYEWFYNLKKGRGNYLILRSKSGTFEMKTEGVNELYGYLLAAATQGKTEQLEGYAMLIYTTSHLLVRDQGFVDGLNKEILKWMKRQEKEAAKAAKAVTKTEEISTQAFMEDVAAFANATPKEQKRIREKNKAAMRKAIKEGKSESSANE